MSCVVCCSHLGMWLFGLWGFQGWPNYPPAKLSPGQVIPRPSYPPVKFTAGETVSGRKSPPPVHRLVYTCRQRRSPESSLPEFHPRVLSLRLPSKVHSPPVVSPLVAPMRPPAAHNPRSISSPCLHLPRGLRSSPPRTQRRARPVEAIPRSMSGSRTRHSVGVAGRCGVPCGAGQDRGPRCLRPVGYRRGRTPCGGHEGGGGSLRHAPATEF